MATTTKKKPATRMKAKVWGETSTMEYDGSIREGIEMAFWYISNPVTRQKVLAQLKAQHDKMMDSAEEKAVQALGVTTVAELPQAGHRNQLQPDT